MMMNDFLERRESKTWILTLERESEENNEEFWVKHPFIAISRAFTKIPLVLNANNISLSGKTLYRKSGILQTWVKSKY
jgi:hypothetical protein